VGSKNFNILTTTVRKCPKFTLILTYFRVKEDVQQQQQQQKVGHREII